MAFLNGITFTGKIGGVTAYKMKGVDKIVLRRSGGPSKEKLNHSPSFALNRQHRQEFGASATLGKYVRFMLGEHQRVANYGIAGKISGLLTQLKHQDTVQPLGKRAFRLSSLPHLLQGFSLNKRVTFNNMIYTAMTWSVSRETRSARIDVSELVRHQNFFHIHNHPYFCITAALGIVPDILYHESKGAYSPPDWFDGMYTPTQVSSPWYPAQEGAPPITLELQLDQVPADESYAIMLSVGVRFGALLGGDTIKVQDHLGVAKILQVV